MCVLVRHMSSLYTKAGDAGFTRLYNGKKVAKDELIFEVLGSIDELCATIGLIDTHLSFQQVSEFRTTLHTLVCRLMDISSLIATPVSQTKSATKLKRVQVDFANLIGFLESQIDSIQSSLPPLKNFIVPIACAPSSAFSHLARTVCRRVERSVVSLKKQSDDEDIPNEVLVYFNRLSDYFFALARALNSGFAEEIYQKSKT